MTDYQKRENLDELLLAWQADSPVPEEMQRKVEAELDDAGPTPENASNRHHMLTLGGMLRRW